MTQPEERDANEMLTVDQLAEEFGLGRSTVWLHLRQHQVPRFRTAATGKTTLVKRGDWEQAIHTPMAVTKHRDTRPGQKDS